MSNKHKHYEMIVAKAANMDLVQFIKMDGEWENAGLSDKFISFSEEYDYFLCLPQHNENGQCLHWLNGGEVESIHKDYEPMTLAESGSIEWSVKSTFMKDSIEIRIKPKKEKRWIGIGRNGFATAHYAEADRCLLEETIRSLCPDAVVCEIEVEV